MDGSSSLLVKFVNDRQRLYFKLTGMVATGVGINRSGLEAETATPIPLLVS